MGTGVCTKHLDGHTGAIEAIDVDWDGSRAASASHDGTIRIWSLRSGISTGILQPDATQGSTEDALSPAERGVICLAVGWGNDRVLSGSLDEALRLFDTKAGVQLSVLERHSEPLRLLSVDWKEMRAVSVSDDGAVNVWDLQSRECTGSFTEPRKARVLAVHSKWTSMQALAVLSDGATVLWDLQYARVNSSAISLGRRIERAAIS